MQCTLSIFALCNVVCIVARNRSEPMKPSQVQRRLLRRYNRADLPPDDGYSDDDITIGWLPSPVTFSPEIHLPSYTLLDMKLSDCTKNYTSGTYPCMKLEFILKRDVGYYLIQLYLPSALVVILSWIAFWSSTHAGLERISIGLLAVLTVTTHSASCRDHLPEVSYITAMDLWMSVCLLFGVASLLESAVVNAIVGEEYVSRRDRRQKHLHERGGNIPLNQLKPDGNVEWQSRVTPIHDLVLSADERAKRMDRVSRIIFPIAFVLFCILYWAFYIYL